MTAFINQNFTIHGTLSVRTLGVSGANITLQLYRQRHVEERDDNGDSCDRRLPI
jgi:hypothetical protein